MEFSGDQGCNFVKPTDPVQLVEHKKMMAKTKQVILKVVKDYLIPHITMKTIGKEMFDTIAA